jgi:hypothetical protein
MNEDSSVSRMILRAFPEKDASFKASAEDVLGKTIYLLEKSFEGQGTIFSFIGALAEYYSYPIQCETFVEAEESSSGEEDDNLPKSSFVQKRSTKGNGFNAYNHWRNIRKYSTALFPLMY